MNQRMADRTGNRPSRVLHVILRCYLRHFPIQRGKWRLWHTLQERYELGDDRVLTETLRHGIRMRLRLWEQFDRFVYFWHCWEPSETRVVEQTLKPGDVFVDVGANAGYYSLLASKLVGPKGRVIAFEPCPEAVARFKENLDLNNTTNVELHECAVSDQTGEVSIFQGAEDGLQSTTIRPVSSPRLALRVPCVTLDDALHDVPKVRLAKIDAEGAELRVIKGFTRFVREPHAPTLLCEVTSPFIEALGGNAEELYSLLDSYGYRTFTCNHMRLKKVDSGTLLQKRQVNVFFTKAATGAIA